MGKRRTVEQKLYELLAPLSADEVRNCYRVFRDIVNQKEAVSIYQFKIGDKVQMNYKHGWWNAKVEKVNRKTISIRVIDSSFPSFIKSWRVAPSLLRKV